MGASPMRKRLEPRIMGEAPMPRKMLRRRTISRDEALTARPIRADRALLTESTDGVSAKLSMPLQAPRRLNWLFRFPTDAKRTFELDSTGLLVWQMCDGRNTVKKIANFVAMRNNASTTEAETATLKFLQMLEARNLIRVNEHE
jgi:hypothetical protein